MSKIHDFSGVLSYAILIECKYLSEAFETFYHHQFLQKMKEDNISQLGDRDRPFCEQQYTHGFVISLFFKFISFDQFNTLLTASNFRHLLSCGTIDVTCLNMLCTIALLKYVQIPSDISFKIYFRKALS